MIVETAASRSRSLTPAASSLPMGSSRSTWISTCRPWWTSSTPSGSAGSPRWPTYCAGSASPDSPSPSLHRERAVLGGVAGGVGVAALGRAGSARRGSARARAITAAPALRVVRRAALPAVVLGEHVGAVERVVERAPAGVGRVGGEPRVEHGYDELRAGLDGDLLVHVAGLDREVGGLLDEVAEVAEQLRRTPPGRGPGPGSSRATRRAAAGARRGGPAARGCAGRSRRGSPRRRLQNAASSIPDPGSASSRTNACRTEATWSPPTVTRSPSGQPR